jgi:hypothetical protein
VKCYKSVVRKWIVKAGGNRLRLVERLVPGSTDTGEFELGQHSKGIEEEMTRRLYSDLKR